MEVAPVVLFVYNRPVHTQKTLEALAVNELADRTHLFIYADGPKENADAHARAEIETVRKLIGSDKWCKEVTIVESRANLGLAGSVIKGVTEVVGRYGRVIVLEDDLVTHPFYLSYMNYYLDAYATEEKVISIHGYMYPVGKKIEAPFFLKGADCWGWATWKRGWDLFNANGNQMLEDISKNCLEREFNFNNSYNFTSLLEAQVAGQVDSWAIRWYASAFLADKLTLYPPVSLVRNIGTDGSGTHGDLMNDGRVLFKGDIIQLTTVPVAEDKKAKALVEQCFRGERSVLTGMLKKLKKYYVRKTQKS